MKRPTRKQAEGRIVRETLCAVLRQFEQEFAEGSWSDDLFDLCDDEAARLVANDGTDDAHVERDLMRAALETKAVKQVKAILKRAIKEAR